jgi:ubiquitin C-terminal hydrolase
LESVFKLRLSHQAHLPQTADLNSIEKIMKPWLRKSKASSSKNEEMVDAIEPLKLRNIGNSCYLDSVLQAILCIDHIREKLSRAPEKDAFTSLKDYQKELAIQQEILQFMDVQQTQKEGEHLSQMEYILFLLGGPSIYRLRDAIFRSEFHHEFDLEHNLTDQHDAANIMELLIDHLLTDCKFKWRGHATTPIFPGLEFVHGGPTGKDEEVAILQVPLRFKPVHQKLDVLVKAILGKHVEKQSDPEIQRKFDPQEGFFIKGKEAEAALIQHASAAKVDEYHEWFRLTKLPPVLTIQFKRFTAGLSKDNKPVILPEDGILDLSRFYDAPTGESKKALYRIKSMVRHSGSSLKFGHYIADVEINGKYYHCNDTDPKPFKEISKKEFFGRKDPYLLFLERIPDDEIEDE